MSAARVGFILLSNRHQSLPSTRISVLNMLPYLRDAGFAAEIAYEPARPNHTPDLSGLDLRALAARYDLVYFQKVHGSSVLQAVRTLEHAGVRTVFGLCDVVTSDMVEATSATAVVTEHLRMLHPVPLRSKMHVVHDGIEQPARRRPPASDNPGSRRRPLRAVLVTSSAPAILPILARPPEWLRVRIVGAYPAPSWRGGRLRWVREQLTVRPAGERLATLSSILDRRIERVPWHPTGVYDQLEQADIGVIPIDMEHAAAWQLKSENRLTLKMAAGLPVITTPIPAYEAVVEHGRNAFFAHGRADWLQHLEALRDPALRQAVGERARAAVLPRFSKEAQAQALIATLQAALARAPAEAAG
ncbi:MAG: glycosyltransferase family 4 protein [Piscinibacter sp.]|uniref:glycosyltransferase family protein n=1 Tax=Piscinibacter sp. TaxID=1903157 RepID=UPI00258ADCED|nr:glycosyltransferase [Piscinibacter sp.]MCW5662625.1 glycosyltransferase family 4 protein [Piscinibacter sp.]